MKKANNIKQNGFSLIEVLISIVIMSFGLLGMAGLQIKTEQYKINTKAQAVTSNHFSEIAEKIRINPNASGNSFDKSSGQLSTSLYQFTDTWEEQNELPVRPKNCEATLCTMQEMATHDITDWRYKVRESLPQGSVFLNGNRISGINAYVMWYDKDFTLEKIDAQTASTELQIQKTAACEASTDGNKIHNCCPVEASTPNGVKCLRMTFTP